MANLLSTSGLALSKHRVAPVFHACGIGECMRHTAFRSSRSLRDMNRRHQPEWTCAAAKLESAATPHRLHRLETTGSITGQAHAVWHDIVQLGDTVVDATCGNGHDALALCHLVGANGHVVMFDIQEEAIENTRWHLQQELSPQQMPQLHFFQGCHSQLQAALQQQDEGHRAPSVVAFNLGYLPSSDRKEVTTQLETTVTAVRHALEVLRPGGCLTVAAYIGHEGGLEECEAVVEVLCGLECRQWISSERQLLNCKNAPRLLLAYKLS